MENKIGRWSLGDVKKSHIGTRLVHGSSPFEPTTGAISYPIYQSATFRHPALNESTGFDYSRLQNPTREVLEKTIADLEEGRHGIAFSTGMAAITAVISYFNPGDHVVVSEDLYGGTYRICETVFKKYGLEFDYCDTSNLDLLKAVLKENTKCIFIESPTNPTMKVTDISALTDIAKARDIITVVDNTFLTPYYQRPLTLGADIVVHSGTKYLGGHNDTLAGFVITASDKLAEDLRMYQISSGAILAPFDCWLILRGIKTLGVRMDKQQENAISVARWLKDNRNVTRVYYVGLEDHSGYEITRKQSDGFGAMISFEVVNVEMVQKILKKVKVIMFAESLGGVESLITYPVVQTHAAIPEEFRKKIGLTDTLLRLSVGIENVNDLIEDLRQAMED